jgi:catechol 2,3-dioxygenase-like lactoylglutathione lyase family enzyme
MPRLDVVGVIVSDLERAIAFYRRLGLRFPEDPDPEGHGHVEATLPEGLRFTLVDAGAESHKEPWDALWGQRYAQVKDPTGTSSTSSRLSRADAPILLDPAPHLPTHPARLGRPAARITLPLPAGRDGPTPARS